MPLVYTSTLKPVMGHFDHLFCLGASLHILLLTPTTAEAFLEHAVQLVGRVRADHFANETTTQRARNIENAQVSPTQLQQMFGMLVAQFATLNRRR